MSELTSNDSEDFFESITKGADLNKDVENVYNDKEYLDEEPDEILQDDKEGLLNTKKDQEVSFWKFEYYQGFFNVDTHEVLKRLLYSFLPIPKSNFICDVLASKPDLYGPFWICTTLVFTIAISGNISGLISNLQKYSLDFKKVTIAASAIYSYWCLIPLFVFGFLKWKSNGPTLYTFLEIFCTYGYSLTIYIPISVLWIVPKDIVQWILLVLGLTLSGAVLVITFWPSSKEENKKFIFILLGFIVVFHTLLAIGFKFYFFDVIEIYDPTHSPSTSKPAT